MVELHAARKALSDALTQLARAAGSRRELSLRVSFHEGELTLAVPGAEVRIPAVGTWPGAAHVPWRHLASICRKLPPGDPMRLAVGQGRFSIGSFALPARWEDISPPPVAAPLNITPLAALQLAACHSDAELATSGLAKILEEARKSLDRRIQSAHEQLHEYGVTKPELAALVDACVSRTVTRVPGADR